MCYHVFYRISCNVTPLTVAHKHVRIRFCQVSHKFRPLFTQAMSYEIIFFIMLISKHFLEMKKTFPKSGKKISTLPLPFWS